MYRQILDGDGNVSMEAIQRISDGAFIPADPANADFLVYAAWVDEGNEPEPQSV